MTGEPLSQPLKATAEVAWVEFNADGSLLLTKSGREVQLWKTESASLHGRPLQHSDKVVATSFSHDGRTVATSIDGARPEIQLWDVATSHRLGPPLSGIRTVTGLRFEEGDRTLLSCSDEGITRRWTLPQGVTKDEGTPVVAASRHRTEVRRRECASPAGSSRPSQTAFTMADGRDGTPVAGIASRHRELAQRSSGNPRNHIGWRCCLLAFRTFTKKTPRRLDPPCTILRGDPSLRIEPGTTERWAEGARTHQSARAARLVPRAGPAERTYPDG